MDGALEVYLDEGGRTIPLETVGPRCLVGELSAMDGQPRSASVRTKTACVLLRIPGSAFRALLRRNPDVLEEMYWQQVSRVRNLGRAVARRPI
jgi:CRP/FNR family cyclic AMP-dependent transcriptional regulator